jgi:hypothetical protein
MALNTWWTSDPAQRYWMEITHREDIGTDLNSPKLPEGYWSYDLVSQVQPGDRVLHWASGAKPPSLVGWSEATGTPTVVPEYTWQPRGTYGRALPGPRTTRGWVLPLGGLRPFAQPPEVQRLVWLFTPHPISPIAHHRREANEGMRQLAQDLGWEFLDGGR